jgi:hypothetical protein
MTRRVIKVIKRESESPAPPAPSAEEILIKKKKDEADDQRDMAAAVEDWISERRENKKAEEVFANSALFSSRESRIESPE